MILRILRRHILAAMKAVNEQHEGVTRNCVIHQAMRDKKLYRDNEFSVGCSLIGGYKVDGSYLQFKLDSVGQSITGTSRTEWDKLKPCKVILTNTRK